MTNLDISSLAFDKPILYKGLNVYPATLKDYTMFKQCSDILTLNTLDEKDVYFLGLPYLEYIYRKSKKDGGGLMSTMLLCVMSIVFKIDTISFFEDDTENVFLNIFKQSSSYDEYVDEYNELYGKYIDCKDADETSDVLKVLEIRLIELRTKMFDLIQINSTEFDELRHLICQQNDIDEELIDPSWEKELQEARIKAASINKTGGLDFRDLLIAVSYDLKKTPDELMNMSIATFDRYVEIMLKRESFNIGKMAEANGAKFKNGIKHWLSHYEPKGKYDDVITDKSDSFIEELD